MGKFLLIFALIIYLGSSSSAKTGDDSYYIIPELQPELFSDPDEGDEDEQKDSVDILSVFSAKIKDKTIYLNWRILNPKNVSYFEILKLNNRKNDYEKINDDKIERDDYFDKSAKSDNEIIYMYDFEDEPERDGVYFYKLKAYNSSGQVLFETDEIKIGITGIRNFRLEQNTPNPFNPVTNITFELFEESYVKLKVFDLIGKEIATLLEGNKTKGIYTVQFDASKYANITSGIYFYKIDTGRYSEVKKMILTK